MQVGAHAAVQEVAGEPGEGFLAVGLGRAAEVGEFGGVDAGEADMDLLKT